MKINSTVLNRVLVLMVTLFIAITTSTPSAHADTAQEVHVVTAPVLDADSLKSWVVDAMEVMRATEPGPEVPWADTYDTTATKIAAAAVEDPLLGDPLRTAAVMVVQGWQESRFRPDVIGDSGASLGMFQIQASTARDVGCSREDLLNPDTNASCALKLLHISFTVCRNRPIAERLAQYAWGHDCNHRLELSRFRMKLVAKLVKEHPFKPPVVVAETSTPALPVAMTGGMAGQH